MAHALLERDHAQAVHHRLGRVTVGQVPDREVREVEAEPDHQLDAEVPPAARQHLLTQRDDSLHDGTLNGAVTGRPAGGYPPMYDISTFGSEAVSSVRSSE